MAPNKKTIVADIIRRLHGGLSVEEAKSEILERVGHLRSSEITEIEQGLIDEGVSPDEIRRFCNVHALLFESALEDQVSAPDTLAVSLLRKDNEEITRLVRLLRDAASRGQPVEDGLARLQGVARHYSLKENTLFPFLEHHGFTGPSKVMWSKHDEIRSLLKQAADPAGRSAALLTKLLDEVEGMVFKEESILFPAALERLAASEWGTVLFAAQEMGYPFAEAADLDGPAAVPSESPSASGSIALPTGSFSLLELTAMLNTLPVDITFVDADDRVRYFSQSKDRVFVRTTAVIGRKVQNCHPPQSLKKVTDILDSFRNGTRSQAEFWISLGGKRVHIRYFAVRDEAGGYLGTLEVTQDITEIAKLTGERRLLDD